MAVRTPTYGIDAGDIVAGQDLFVVAEADDELGVFVSLAALRFTVTAVQLHLDLTLAVTLHDWPQHNVETRARQPEPRKEEKQHQHDIK